MAAPLKYSNAWQDLVAADRIVCRSLHVGESATGVLSGGSGPGNFTTLTVSGASSFGGNVTLTAPITSSSDITCHNLTASQTVTANALSANSLNATSATLPAITGVVTINGAPYPPPGSSAGGPVVDVVTGLVFPTMTIPAGGSGAYRVTNASLAGMTNNAADPGAGNGGPGAAGLAFVTGFNGDATGRTELLLFNASSYALTFAAPIVTLSATRGRVWWPGASARATRATAVSATWVVQVEDTRFVSSMLTNTASINSRATLPAGTTLASAGLEYSVHGFSDAASDDALLVVEGVFSVSLDRTGDPAPTSANIDVVCPVLAGASSAWSALPGFLPPFGTLDEAVSDKSQGAYDLQNQRIVGAGAVFNVSGASAWCTINSDSAFALRLRIFGIGTQTSVIATGSFRFVANTYDYVATF